MIAAALTLGFLGSLHCVGMCGPLVLAMPAGSGGASRRWARRAVYHLGRSLTYGLMGAALGGLGLAASLAGMQGALSIFAGLLVLFFAWPRRVTGSGSGMSAPGRWMHALRGRWQSLLAKPGWWSMFSLGALNGLLPCGLVYAALAGSAMVSTVGGGFFFMVAFGLATMPALLAVSAAPVLLRPSWRAPLRRLAPVASCALAVLLICRGFGFSPCCASLGTPPDAGCCHSDLPAGDAP
jgi:sulfite exporter TauE/SafE